MELFNFFMIGRSYRIDYKFCNLAERHEQGILIGKNEPMRTFQFRFKDGTTGYVPESAISILGDEELSSFDVAAKELGFNSLFATGTADDFKTIHITALKSALEAAYRAGKESGESI